VPNAKRAGTVSFSFSFFFLLFFFLFPTTRIPSPSGEEFRVSRIWREIARGTTPKDSERAITAFVLLPLAPCVVGVAEEEASGEAPERVPARNEGPQTCSTSSHNTWTGGRLSHMARARRTLRQRLPPPPPPGVKLNFGYTGCAKCPSRRWDAL